MYHCGRGSISDSIVDGNRVSDHPNGGGYGAGIFVDDCSLSLRANTIVSNSTGSAAGALLPGGGVYIASTRTVTLTNNIIAHNHASDGGGVAVGHYSVCCARALLVNNTIADNEGRNGIWPAYHAEVTLQNNVIAGHGQGIALNPGPITITADTNLFWNTTDPITGTHAILRNPHLSADHRLSSAVIDRGLTIPWLIDDCLGHHRPQGPAYDLGACELWPFRLPLLLKKSS